MELDPPVKGPDSSYDIPIKTAEHISLKYRLQGSTTAGASPYPDKNMPELKTYITAMATPVNAYSVKWMSAPLGIISFFKMVSNIWGIEGAQTPMFGATSVQQTWYPEKININIGSYSIYWKLVDQVYYGDDGVILSGTETIDSIPFSSEPSILKIETSLRAILKKRIRRYRTRAAFYEMRVNQLSKRYYDRYGITEHTDNDSVLSLDTDDSE